MAILAARYAMVVTGNSRFSSEWRAIVWMIALTVMGTGCLVNAKRCVRVHCYLTRPFFLVMAVVTLLYGAGVMRIGRRGWNRIGLTVLVGAIVLCCLPEMVFGKYRRAREGGSNRNRSRRASKDALTIRFLFA